VHQRTEMHSEESAKQTNHDQIDTRNGYCETQRSPVAFQSRPTSQHPLSKIVAILCNKTRIDDSIAAYQRWRASWSRAHSTTRVLVVSSVVQCNSNVTKSHVSRSPACSAFAVILAAIESTLLTNRSTVSRPNSNTYRGCKMRTKPVQSVQR
jgi:hypothetical protein